MFYVTFAQFLAFRAYVLSFVWRSFPVDERGTMKSVVEYFRETYGFVIQHTLWPCLQVGNQQRPNYLPMEVGVLPWCPAVSAFTFCFFVSFS